MRHPLSTLFVAGTIVFATPCLAGPTSALPTGGQGEFRLAQTTPAPKNKTATTDRARQLEQTRNRARTEEASQNKTATTDRARQLEQTRNRARTEEGKTPQAPQ
jgi:hypothetical protein